MMMNTKLLQGAFLLMVLMLTADIAAGKKRKPVKVYKDKCYWVDDKKTIYVNALKVCQKYGGKVITFSDINVEEAAEAFKDLVGANEQFWIGMVENNNGMWHWEGSNIDQTGNSHWHPPSRDTDGHKCASAQRPKTGYTYIYVGQVCRKTTLITMCCKEDAEGCDGDPHFLIYSSGADNTHLCFDVDGQDGDVVMLLQDSDLKLQVNGELFETNGKGFKKAFFSAIAVLCGDDEIIATKDHITINGVHTVYWDEVYSVDLINEGVVESVGLNTTIISLASDVQLEITRGHTRNNETYLGFFIIQDNGITDSATGIIGNFIGSNFTAVRSLDDNSQWTVEFSEHPLSQHPLSEHPLSQHQLSEHPLSEHQLSEHPLSHQPLSIPVHRAKRYSRSHGKQIECWNYKVNNEASVDDLLGRRSEYTVNGLKYTPF